MSSQPHISRFKRLARRVARPVTSPIDGRVADINRRVGVARSEAEQRGAMLNQRIDQAENALAAAVGSYARASTEAMSYVGVELRRFEGRQDQFEQLLDQFEQLILHMRESSSEEYHRERLAHVRDAPLEKLDGDLAWLLNHASGHQGFAAQAGLWFNPPLIVELLAGGARLANVNERIVEVPFAMSVLGRLSPPARILDIGSAESTFALSAASLGYQVTAVDLRPLAYSHPNLTSFAGRFEDWDPPREKYSAAFLISTIEHVGLGAYGELPYGEPIAGEGADRQLLNRVGKLLAPDGLLVLTTPWGVAGTSELEHVYDDESLAALLGGWAILERRTVRRLNDVVWVAEAEPKPGQSGTVMVLATPTSAV